MPVSRGRTLALLLAFWVFSFGVVPAVLTALGVDFGAPDTWPERAWVAFAVAALVADIALAVPTGVIVTTLGGTFGLVGGTALGTLGLAGATLTGWALGRAGSALAGAIPDDDPVRAAVRRWGPAALIALRPVPIAAESAALVAGAEGLPAGHAVLAALVGGLPTALMYASIGAGAKAVAAPGWVPLAAAVTLGALAAAVGARLRAVDPARPGPAT